MLKVLRIDEKLGQIVGTLREMEAELARALAPSWAPDPEERGKR